MATASELALLITAKDQASKTLDDVGKSAGGLGKHLGDVAKIAGGFVVASGIMKLGGFLVDAAKGAADDAASTARLEQAINNTGVAFDSVSGKIGNVISAGQKLGFTDDQTRDSLSLLAAQTGDTEEAVKRYALAQDLARGANIDVVTASKLLGKVTDENVNVLNRYGISVKKGASEAELFGAVQEKFGGQAQTFANTTAGKMAILSDKFGELKETIGGAVIPIMTALANVALGVIPTIEKLANLVGPVLAAAFSAVGGAAKTVLSVFSGMKEIIKGPSDGFGSFGGKVSKLGGAFKAVAGVIKTVLATFSGIKEAIKGPSDGFGSFGGKVVKLGATMQAIVTVIKAVIPVFGELGGAITVAVQGFIAVFKTLLPIIQPIFDQLINVITTVVGIIANTLALVVNIIKGDWAAAWENLKAIVSLAVDFVLTTIRNFTALLDGILSLAWEGIKLAAGLAWEGIKALVGLAWDGIKALVSAGVTEVTASFNHLLSEIGRIVGGLPGLLIGLAQQAFDGFIGILNQIPGAIAGLASEALNAARTMGANVYLGIKGEIEDLPGVLYDLGKQIIGGLASGISDSAHSVYNTAREIAGGIVDAAKKGLGDLLPGSPSKLGLEIPIALAQGISENEYLAVRAATDMAGRIEAETLSMIKSGEQTILGVIQASHDDINSERIRFFTDQGVGTRDQLAALEQIHRDYMGNIVEVWDDGILQVANNVEAMRAALRSAEQMGYSIPNDVYKMHDFTRNSAGGDEMSAALAHARQMGYTLPPGFAHGTSYVPRTGLAMLHKGEAVIPAGQNRGGVELHVHLENRGTIVGVQNAEQWVGQAVRNVMLRGGLDIIQRAV